VKIARLFLCSPAAILLLTATVKFVSSFGHESILQALDPLTGFQFQNLFRMIAGIEIVVALLCLFSECTWLPVGLIAWLATSFAIYRLMLSQIGWHKPCNCLGNLMDALHIPPQTADTAMKIILAYLLVGSYVTLFWLWRQRRGAASTLR